MKNCENCIKTCKKEKPCEDWEHKHESKAIAISVVIICALLVALVITLVFLSFLK